jgi:hypothetical protein
MNINLIFEIIFLLLAILASNGIIYSLTVFNFKTQNSSENISVITNNSEKDVLANTLLIASNPLRLTSSESSASDTSNISSLESSASDTLSVTSSDTYVSDTLSVTSSDTYVSEDIIDNNSGLYEQVNEGMTTQTQNALLPNTNDGTIPSNLDVNLDVFGNATSLDSVTILNSQSYEQWREIATALHEFPTGTPWEILRIFKFEELKILYSQDMIQYAITQTELRLLIDLLPATDLCSPGINHFILTMMSYYHL